MKSSVVVPGLVRVCTNVDVIYHFAFSERMVFRGQGSETIPITVNYDVASKLNWSIPPDKQERFHYFFGLPDQDHVSYERQIAPGYVLRGYLEGLSSNQPTLKVNSSYSRLPFRINNIFPPGAHLTDIVTVLLMRTGFIPVCAASFLYKGRAVLLFGPPDTGKTMTVINALKTRVADGYLSEDVAITNGKIVFSCPYTISFRHGSYVGNNFERCVSSLVKISPIFALLSKRLTGDLSSLVPNLQIVEKAELGPIFLLKRAGERVKIRRKLSVTEALGVVKSINRYEFTYYRNPLLRVYSYWNPSSLCLEFMMAFEESVLSDILSNHQVWEIICSEPEYFLEQILLCLEESRSD